MALECRGTTLLYSIGHGNRTLEAFLRLLHFYDCRYLADVRSSPYSKFHPHFSKENLAFSLKASGISYVYMGDTLGGRPKNPRLYDETGRANYDAMAAEPAYISGIDRLSVASKLAEVTFIMCSELCPTRCHRLKLIGRSLQSAGVELLHLTGSDEVLSQDAASKMLTNGQGDLFEKDAMLRRSVRRYV